MATIVARLFNDLRHAHLCANVALLCGFGREDISFLHSLTESQAGNLGNEPHPLEGRSEELGHGVTVHVADVGPLVAYGALRALLPRTVSLTSTQLQDALMSLGLTEEESVGGLASLWHGSALLFVRAPDHWEEPLKDLLDKNHGYPITEPSGQERIRWESASHMSLLSRGETRQDAFSRLPSHIVRARRHPSERDFRSHFYLMHPNCEHGYEQCAEAYHYGYALAKSQRYIDKPWPELKPAIQKEWQATHHEPWEEREDMVAYGFIKWRAYYRPEMLRRKR